MRWFRSLALPFLLAGALFGDSTLFSTEVPNALIPQGEVRLVVRGEETIVQSVIRTRFPGKVLAKIVKSEQANWPGNTEMETYVAALAEAFSEYENQPRSTALVIDFIGGPGGTRVDLAFAPGAVWRSLALSPGYIRKNQEYILADAFGKEAPAVIEALRKLDPMEDTRGN